MDSGPVMHQPPPVSGYRALSDAEIGLMNEAKALAVQVGAFIEKVGKTNVAYRVPFGEAPPPPSYPGVPEHDPRWLAIAQTQLQQGFMALTRSIARPTTF